MTLTEETLTHGNSSFNEMAHSQKCLTHRGDTHSS